MPKRLLWRLSPAKPLEVRRPSTIRLVEVLDGQGRPMLGARVKLLVEAASEPEIEPPILPLPSSLHDSARRHAG
jgi:hypothetical protein